MSKKISKLVIECPNETVVHKIKFDQEELDNVVKLESDGRVSSVIIVDKAVHGEGEREIEWKRIRKSVDKLEIYAVNRAPFKVFYGFGGYAFEERRSGIQTNLGFSGTCTLEVNSFSDLRNSFDNMDDVSEMDINDIVRARVCELVKMAIGDELHRVRRDEIEPLVLEIKNKDESDSLTRKLKSYFASKGLVMKEYDIRVNYPDEFLSKYQDYADREASSKQTARELERLKDLK